MGLSRCFSRIWIAFSLNICAKSKDMRAQSPQCGFWGVGKMGPSQCFSRIWIALLNISESWRRWGCRVQGEGRPERPQARSPCGGTRSGGHVQAGSVCLRAEQAGEEKQMRRWRGAVRCAPDGALLRLSRSGLLVQSIWGRHFSSWL